MKPLPQADLASPAISRRFVNKKTIPWIIVGVLVVCSVFLFGQYRAAEHKLRAGGIPTASKQVTDVITKVRKLIILPADETPTVATVKNADKLKGQSFFVSAKEGDKVVVYSREKLAILYRPSVNQIVTVQSVSVSPNTAPTQPATSP